MHLQLIGFVIEEFQEIHDNLRMLAAGGNCELVNPGNHHVQISGRSFYNRQREDIPGAFFHLIVILSLKACALIVDHSGLSGREHFLGDILGGGRHTVHEIALIVHIFNQLERLNVPWIRKISRIQVIILLKGVKGNQLNI